MVISHGPGSRSRCFSSPPSPGREAPRDQPPRPALPTPPPLDAVATQEPQLAVALAAEIAEPRDVRPGGPAAVHVLVLEAGHRAARARLGDVVHQIVAHFAARVGEPSRETPGLRV